MVYTGQAATLEVNSENVKQAVDPAGNAWMVVIDGSPITAEYSSQTIIISAY